MTARFALLAGLGLLALAAAPSRGGAPFVPEPDTYRAENYRAPTPVTLAGARVVTTPEAEAIWKRGNAAFVDVLPRPPKPANLPAGTVWREAPRLDIPGSVWLPDTGYGALAAVTEDYLRRGLERASGGQRDRMLVVYCLRNCWHSWNAVKRVLSMGYANVAWYPEGTDGWEQAGLPLSPALPEPGCRGQHIQTR